MKFITGKIMPWLMYTLYANANENLNIIKLSLFHMIGQEKFTGVKE